MQRQGYAKESAAAVRDWTFINTPFQMIYSYMPKTNEPSIKTAIAYGCHEQEEFSDEADVITKVLAISRTQWLENQKKSNRCS